jgi:hypothetical protein
MKKTFAIAFVAAVAVVTAGGLAINRSNPVVMKDGTRSSIASKPADAPIPTCYPDQSCH